MPGGIFAMAVWRKAEVRAGGASANRATCVLNLGQLRPPEVEVCYASTTP